MMDIPTPQSTSDSNAETEVWSGPDEDAIKLRQKLVEKGFNPDIQDNCDNDCFDISSDVESLLSHLSSSQNSPLFRLNNKITGKQFQKELESCRARSSRLESFSSRVLPLIINSWVLPRLFQCGVNTETNHKASSCPLLHLSSDLPDETTLSSPSDMTVFLDSRAILEQSENGRFARDDSFVLNPSNQNVPCCFPFLFIKTTTTQRQPYATDIANADSALAALNKFLKFLRKAGMAKEDLKKILIFYIYIDADTFKVQSCGMKNIFNKSSKLRRRKITSKLLYKMENYSSIHVDASLHVLLNKVFTKIEPLLSQACTTIEQRYPVREQPMREAKKLHLNQAPESIVNILTTPSNQRSPDKAVGLKRKRSTAESVPQNKQKKNKKLR